MCGICGFHGFRDDSLLDRMCSSIKHRGPDQEGLYIEDKVSLGHKRLSIIDLSSYGKQPMTNEDESLWLSYNGEIYNFQDLMSDLKSKGHTFKSHTDSEVILHSYEEKGTECVSNFRGMFAFALWDKGRNRLVLCRDRFGEKPLYYWWDGKRFVFASEIKALLECQYIPREVNKEGFYSYLAFQYVPGIETAIKNVYRVPPAHMLILENNTITFLKYWDINTINTETWRGSEQEALENLRLLLKESVNMRLVSDVPLGVLLSGGLDSSSVVSLMSDTGAENIKTFSVGFGEKGDELEYAKSVSRKFGTEHREFIIRPTNLIKTLDKIVWHLDEPIADGGAFATFLVSEIVRDYVKVILVGEGADELFGGYSWHKLGSPYLDLIPKLVKKRLYFYLNTLYRGWDNASDVYKRFEELFCMNNRKSFLYNMSLFEINNLLPNCLLMKVDKMTMAHSIEARAPFLDHKLVEFVFALQRNYKIRGITGKYILRRVMKDSLPQEILERKKRGFLVPLDRWLEGGLSEYAKEVLTDKHAFSKEFLEKEWLLDLFKPRRGLVGLEYRVILWRLFIFEIWHKFYIKGTSNISNMALLNSGQRNG